MRATLIVCMIAWTACVTADARDPRPAAHCVDARQIRETWQSDGRTLAIRLEDDSRHRIELADDCAGANTVEQPRLLTRGGWLCGGNDELLQVDQRSCPVAGMAAIDAREFAEHARVANQLARSAMLDRVEVRGERIRSFAGTSAYCIAPNHVRGWNMDADGMVVEVSPRRAGGNRYYRVEMAGYCSELRETHSMELRSGMGIGAICGNPGDAVIPVASAIAPPSPFAGDAVGIGSAALAASRSAFATRRPPGSIGSIVSGSMAASECSITRVYPIDRD
jgi:hypothetical protein